jgi:hypothetical protein
VFSMYNNLKLNVHLLFVTWSILNRKLMNTYYHLVNKVETHVKNLYKFQTSIILCILIKNIFVQDFKVINTNSWNANKHMNNLFFLWLVQQCYSHLFYGINNLLQFHIEVSQLKCVDHLYEHKPHTNKIHKELWQQKSKKKSSNSQTKNKRSGPMSKVLQDHVCFGST